MASSQYSDLYKNRNSNERKQSDRRQQLLAQQKEHRNNDQDDSRNIQEFLQSLQHKVNKKTQKRLFKNYVQLSEWLHEKPDDLERWFMVPCPKGTRCIAVATNGSTKIYSKHGVFITEFRSSLPGDVKQKQATTILDCFSVTANRVTKYMVLDVMFYSNTEMLNCETSFRFFWIACKLSELQMDDINFHNEFAFIPMKYVDCGEEIAVDTCLTTYPMWDDDTINLDGLLFYHKDASYVHGTTPLVGWLFSFMLNETLGFCMVHPKYLEQRPADYVDADTYIADFDKALKAKAHSRNRRSNGGTQRMDEDVDDDNDDNETLNSMLNAERTLELEGRTVDESNGIMD